MLKRSHLRTALVAGVSAAAFTAITAPAAAQTATGQSNAIQELVVTAQRREEALQDVPVAVSAFSQESLRAKRIDGGENLVQSVPNVNFSRSNFGGFNLQIRGIGQKVVTGGAESGVSINLNNLPIVYSHFQDTDFYDVERVEVSRGPQGTLYGRNATGGAVNVITAKPGEEFAAGVTGEYANYDSVRLKGFVNIPVAGETLGLRLAGFRLKRDGYGTNSFTGARVDDRDLWATRATVAFRPTDRFQAYLIWEHYKEDDHRNRIGKALCITDPGQTSIGGVATSAIEQALTSQGCLPGSLYSSAAYGTVNTSGSLGGIYALELGLANPAIGGGNLNAGHALQDTNLHNISSFIDPVYRNKQDILQLQMSFGLTDNLRIETITGYTKNKDFNREDYTRVSPSVAYNTTPTPGCYYCVIFGAVSPTLYPTVFGATFPGGYVTDPQIGRNNSLAVFDQYDRDPREKTQEIRLINDGDGRLTYTVGAIYNEIKVDTDYYVFFNSLTGLAQLLNLTGRSYFVDPNPVPNRSGHNYYLSHQGYHLESTAVFGEAYYQLAENLRVTAGLRRTRDKKEQDNYPVQLFVPGPGGEGTPDHLTATFHATTGRLNLEWTPKLSFTERTLVYGSYSRGYKSGGFNTPCQTLDLTSGNCGYPSLFAPEHVDAFEVGAKNTLAGGSLILNLTAFHYKYSGYQISTIIQKSSVNTNIDAKIWGVELESVWRATHALTFNANLGLLRTKITDGAVVDQLNLAQGTAGLTLVKDSAGENCLVNSAALSLLLRGIAAQPSGAQALALLGSSSVPGAVGVCGGQYAALGLYNYGSTPMQVRNFTVSGNLVPVGVGVPASLKGNKLPNSPPLTVSLGAQYVWELPRDWSATLRGDYYWQDDSYSQIFNTVANRLHGYDNVNATLTFANGRGDMSLQLFVKNLTDKQPITDAALASGSSGLFWNTFTLDPRTYGVALTKSF